MSVRFPIDHMKSYVRNLLKHILKLSRPWVFLSQYTFFWENILVLTHFDQMNNPQSLLESYGSQLFLTICHNPRFLIPTKAVRIMQNTFAETPTLIFKSCPMWTLGQCLSTGHVGRHSCTHIQIVSFVDTVTLDSVCPVGTHGLSTLKYAKK